MMRECNIFFFWSKAGRDGLCDLLPEGGEALSWPKFHFHSNCPLFPPHLSAFRTSKLNWSCLRGFASFSVSTICTGGILTNKNHQLWFSLSDLSSIGGLLFAPLQHILSTLTGWDWFKHCQYSPRHREIFQILPDDDRGRIGMPKF